MKENNLELYKLKARLCKTFSDPKRLIILDSLRYGEKSVGELVQMLDANQAIVSRQLAILRDRGIVTSRHEGTTVYYSLTDSRICDACDVVHEILLNQMEKNREMAERLMK
jgi:ArsR family transcriptional regulator, virulence genes transcriptional regulator